MPTLKIEMFSTQKSAMTLLFIDFDFFPDLQGQFGWFVNHLSRSTFLPVIGNETGRLVKFVDLCRK